jgi:two-component system response regulator VicR
LKVLLIEDDENMVDYIENVFDIGWPEAEFLFAYNGQKGLDLTIEESPDLILLDLGLPDINGFEVLKQIRNLSSIPVMIITVRGEESDVIKGLSLGADEYIVKPFRQLELLARIRALVRRQPQAKEDLSIGYGPLHFGESLCDIIYGKREITVTPTEGRILYKLIKNKGKVVTTSDIAREIWGKYPDSTGNVKTYIYRLRKKLENEPENPKLILSKPGIGYFIKV